MITRRTLIVGTTAGLAGAALSGPARAQQTQQPTIEQVYFDPGNPVLGNPKGDVTIAEFFDFQCPYCKRDFPMVHRLVKADGNIRLVMKDWPIFGGASIDASHLALAAAKAGKYHEVFDPLMKTKARFSEADMQSTLKSAGVDIAALQADYAKNRKEIDATLARNNALAEAFQMPGTPGYVIGHQVFRGVITEAVVEEAVRQARKPA